MSINIILYSTALKKNRTCIKNIGTDYIKAITSMKTVNKCNFLYDIQKGYTVEPTYNEHLQTAIFSSLKARVRSTRFT